MSTVREFTQRVIEAIESRVKEIYPEATLEFKDVGEVYSDMASLHICPTPNARVSMSYKIEETYRDYQNGVSFETICDGLVNSVEKAQIPTPSKTMISVEDMVNWDSVNARIVPSLVGNKRANHYKTAIKDTLGDMTILYRLIVGEGMSAVIDENLVNTWEVTINDIREVASRNIKEHTANITSLENALFSSMCNDKSSSIAVKDMADNDFYVASIEGIPGGAELILNQTLLDEIREQIGDFIIIPSSTHEVLIASKAYAPKGSELSNMIKSVNADCVSEEDFLSDTPYEYTADRMVKAVALENKTEKETVTV